MVRRYLVRRNKHAESWRLRKLHQGKRSLMRHS